MKKHLLTLSVLIGMLLCFSSCTSQMERDATHMAKRGVELKKSIKRMEDHSNLGGRRMTEEEYQKQARDYIEFANRLHHKYSETPEMQEAFYKLVKEKEAEFEK